MKMKSDGDGDRIRREIGGNGGGDKNENRNDIVAYNAPSAEECACSETDAASVSAAQTVDSTQGGTKNSEWKRDFLMLQTAVLSAGSAFAMVSFVVACLPYTALWWLAVLSLCSGMTLHSAYQLLVAEAQAIIRGGGVGQFLPPSLYRQLAEMSLHEFMTQPSSSIDSFQFLLLYFIPGITPAQLNAYIARLSPQHQSILNRRGLGHFLGDDFMRLVVGERQWNEIAPTPQQVTIISEHRGPPEEETAQRSDRSRGLAIEAQPVPATQKDDEKESPGDEVHDEWQVLSDAITSSTMYFSALGYNYVMDCTRSLFTSTRLARTGVALTVFSLGFGAFDMWNNVFNPSRTNRLGMKPYFHTTYAMLLTGGITAGSTMMLGSCFAPNKQHAKKKPTSEGN